MESENELLLLGALGVGAYFLLAKPLGTALEGVGGGIADFGQSVGTLSKNVGENVGDVLTETSEVVQAIGGGVQTVLEEAKKDVRDVNSKIVNPIITNTGTTTANITDTVADVSGNIHDIVGGTGNFIEGAILGTEKVISKIPSTASKIVGSVYTSTDKALGGVLPGGSKNVVVPAVSKIAVKTVSNVANVIKATPQAVISTVQKSVNVGTQAVKKVSSFIGGLFKKK
jgi:gas vesicle protein